MRHVFVGPCITELPVEPHEIDIARDNGQVLRLSPNNDDWSPSEAVTGKMSL